MKTKQAERMKYCTYCGENASKTREPRRGYGICAFCIDHDDGLYCNDPTCPLCGEAEYRRPDAEDIRNDHYVSLARETLGTAVRDNSRATLIEIGKQIETGTWGET